jgi:hypothetical protein
MKRIVDVTSVGAPAVPSNLRLVTSIHPQSGSPRSAKWESPPSAASRIQVERVFRQAL